MDLTGLSEQQAKWLNQITNYRDGGSVQVLIDEVDTTPNRIIAQGESLKEVENETDFIYAKPWQDLMQKASLFHQLKEFNVIKKASGIYVEPCYELDLRGIEIFNAGGFVKERQNQIEIRNRQYAQEQATIDAPGIANRANIIALIAVVFSVVVPLLIYYLSLPSEPASIEEKPKTEAVSMNQSSTPDNELEKRALEFGDTIAYNQLGISYLDYKHGMMLPIAEKMAAKYNYGPAHFDIYWHSLRLDTVDDHSKALELCDDITRTNAIKHLKIAAEMGILNATEELANLDTSLLKIK